MRKRAAILILLMGFLLPRAKAQGEEGRIRGLVRDELKKPVVSATIELLQISQGALQQDKVQNIDSVSFTVVKTTKTDENGRFDLKRIPVGGYYLRVSSVGYQAEVSAGFELGSGRVVVLDTLRLRLSGSQLEGVQVRGRRPAIEVKADRTLINVESSIGNMGATALEVLQRSPGVSVDKDGNISLKGKARVLIMLDGKPSYLSGADLAGLLGSMSANQLDQIEIMTNPPANYDAAGNAGIINIKTKKNRSRGFNGNISTGYGQGRYWKTTNSLNLNYRDNKKNLFLGYTSNASEGFIDLHNIRSYVGSDGKTITAVNDQPTYLTQKLVNNSLKLGMDYYLSKQTTVGVQLSGFINPRHSDGDGQGFLEDGNGVVDSVIHTSSRTRTRIDNGAINLNLRHVFDSTRELSFDADLIEYDGKNPQLYVNKTTSPSGVLLDSGQLKGELPSTIKIWSGKVDYDQVLNEHSRFEAGWKSSYVQTNSSADYYNLQNGNWEPDYDKTNRFLYNENINAVYGNYDWQNGKWTVQAGLRFENTNYHGHQLGNPMRMDSSFSRHYNNLFPNANIGYKANASNQFSLLASRRIDRPVYQDLNPFLFFINQVTYQTGNPFLRPQYTTSVTVSHVYKELLTTSLYFSRTDPYFAQLFRTTGNTTIFGNYNVGSLDSWGISEDVQLAPLNWWTVTLHADLIYKKVDGSFNGNVLRTEAFVGLFNGSTQMRLGKGWIGELSGFFNTRDLQDQFNLRPQGQFSAGLSKQILEGRGTIKANIQDIFYTDISRGLITYQDVREHFVQKTDTRVFNLSFTCRFGKGARGAARRSNGGAKDEQGRVKF